MAKLTVNEASSTFTHVYTIDYVDLIALGTAGQVTIATIPAGGAVELVVVDESVAFAGSSTVVIDVGTTSADPDEFIDALDVDAMTVPVINTGDLFTSNYTKAVKPVASATPIILELTDANIATATAGELTIGMRILDLRQFA
jgi:hypothetical protein